MKRNRGVKMRNRSLICFLISLAVIPLTIVYGEEKPKMNKLATDALSTSSTVNIATENLVFKKVVVSGDSGSYRVVGQVKSQNGSFYYTVEDGHHQQIQETRKEISGDATEWSTFVLELKIPEELLPQNGTLMLNLYERNNGAIVHNYPAVLEKFYERKS
jgi:hypothetical protein